ncbi:hypothetical protein ACIHEI_17150 [Kitasatospora sp. NPDC051984]|uniref:hypothetical protein n=1 Tax=Kitasatospora sp. NPDC051984 TaxID=3364059 RepID=UPI0037CB2A25
MLQLDHIPVLNQLPWLVPSRWALGAMAATIDLHAIVPGSLTDDPLLAHRAGIWLLDVGMLIVLAVLYGLIVAGCCAGTNRP